MSGSKRRMCGASVVVVFVVVGGCDSGDSAGPPPGEPVPVPVVPATDVLQAITEQFNNVVYVNGVATLPCSPSAVDDTTYLDTSKCSFESLASSGVFFHGWDDTELLPTPWVQQYEQGHSDMNSSGGMVTNWGRAALLPTTPYMNQDTQAVPYTGAKDGFLNVFSTPFTAYPSLGGVIFRTSNPPELPAAPNLASMMCGCVGDCGDDTKSGFGQDGCGCADQYVDPSGGACYGFAPGDVCGSEGPFAACAELPGNQCPNCNGSCAMPLTVGTTQTTCYVRPTYTPPGGTPQSSFPGLMQATIGSCQTDYKAGGSVCYNEVLIDVSDWFIRQGDVNEEGYKILTADNQWQNVKYWARQSWFPNVVAAFVNQKNYNIDPIPTVALDEPTPPANLSGSIITTRAWFNYQLIYGASMTVEVPLLEFDSLTNISPPDSGSNPTLTEPFSIICANLNDTSAPCLAARTKAGIPLKYASIICPYDQPWLTYDDYTFPGEGLSVTCSAQTTQCAACGSGQTAECISIWSPYCSAYADPSAKTCYPGDVPCLQPGEHPPVVPVTPLAEVCLGTQCQNTSIPCLVGMQPSGDAFCIPRVGSACPVGTLDCHP